ncbi:MAG: hypothetical protein LJE96_22455 [Deltaproteobacteria bacterium]|nr:hypothetical protein [Deltaproteobacteria bacterium]
MEQTLMKTMYLNNGLKLEIYDISRKLAGDRWYVGMIVRIDIPLTNLRSTNQLLSNYSVEEIRDAVGEIVRFQEKRERHYIDEREKDAMLLDMMDSFVKTTLSYLSHADFPGKYVLKEFKEHQKQQAWRQNDHRGDENSETCGNSGDST